MAISRDVSCPVCGAAPRENCQNLEMGTGRGDMGRFCHYRRWLAAIHDNAIRAATTAANR